MNLVPFPPEVNLGGMRVFENMLADRLAAGERLYVQAYVRYADEGNIPDEMHYRAWQFKGDDLVKTDDRLFDVAGGDWLH